MNAESKTGKIGKTNKNIGQNSENFIDRLLNETLDYDSMDPDLHHSQGSDQSSDLSSNVLDLTSYFAKKEKLQQQKSTEMVPPKKLPQIIECLEKGTIAYEGIIPRLSCFSGTYLPSIKCVRFVIYGQILDFPCNWSFLDTVNFVQTDTLRNSRAKIIHLNQYEDAISLLKIINSLLPADQPRATDLIFLDYRGNSKKFSFLLIFFTEDNRELLTELLNYCNE
ncbi:MAG: hypothetical protein HQK53_15570 [Oligoflexia bacterium]|nr:hypothetical protein [Oligoflexia bacterium]